MREQHRRHASVERFTDLPLQNGNLVKTYHRDFIERRSRENLVGLCTEQEVDERIFETTVKRPVGILKNSPTRTTPASTPEGSAPSTSILKTSFQPLYQPYEERQPPFVQQPNYHQTNYPITYTQPYFHEQPRLPLKNTSYDFEGPRFQQNVYRPTTESTFNYPFCNAQPNIPVYLIVSGILLITNGSIRLCTYIPTPKSANRSTLMTDLCIYGLEGIILLGIVIVVILGCIWVYGSKWYIHFHEGGGIYEEYYCDWSLYWFAWWSVTLHLVIGVLVIFAVLCILMYGSCAI